MDKFNCHEDVNLLSEFLRHNRNNRKDSNITPFSNIDRIYKWTNEEFELYPKDNLEGKKVLTITASADHALDAVLKGAKEIDSIDINVFCKYYSALKIAMIKKYDYNDFYQAIRRFTSYNEDYNRRDILDNIEQYLTAQEIYFWAQYIKFSEKLPGNLFWVNDNDYKFNGYNSIVKYNNLKDRLDDVNIKYYDGDLVNINEILKNRTYDFVYLSNVLERMDGEYSFENKIELTLKFLKHLNDNAIIYNYSLGIDDYFVWFSNWFKSAFTSDCYYAEKLGLDKEDRILVMKKK